jgi:hypothetical protein
MKEFFKRLSSETPVFFKKLRNMGLYLGATGTAIIAIPGIPDILKNHASTAIWIGAVVAAVSQLTCSDPNQLKQ